MYKVELHPKQSVLEDIIVHWCASGRSDNTKEGSFIFLDIKSWNVTSGTLFLVDGDGKSYLYNMADFYRVKVSPQK